MKFRQFQEKDFNIAENWGRQVYPPEFWESNESFRKRLQQFPEGCQACANDDDEIIGYMFCHPWDDTVVPLNYIDFKLPEKPTCFYIHDIAVVPAWRQKGIARTFVEMAIKLAYKHNYNTIKGVSVLGSLQIWERLGFKHISKIPYGGDHLGVVIRLELLGGGGCGTK